MPYVFSSVYSFFSYFYIFLLLCIYSKILYKQRAETENGKKINFIEVFSSSLSVLVFFKFTIKIRIIRI